MWNLLLSTCLRLQSSADTTYQRDAEASTQMQPYSDFQIDETTAATTTNLSSPTHPVSQPGPDRIRADPSSGPNTRTETVIYQK